MPKIHKRMLLLNETKLLSVCMICHLLLLDFHLVKMLNNFEEYYICCIFFIETHFLNHRSKQ